MRKSRIVRGPPVPNPEFAECMAFEGTLRVLSPLVLRVCDAADERPEAHSDNMGEVRPPPHCALASLF
eukprot:5115897-Prymnesium_polylepis.1